MTRTSTLILLSFLALGCKGWEKFAVPFGEHASHMRTPDVRVIRLFLDQEGFPYPEHQIRDKQLKKGGYSVAGWIQKYPHKAEAVFRSCSIPDSLRYSDRMERLHDSLVLRKLRSIQAVAGRKKSLYVLIHGFRKKAYGKKKRTSFQDYQYLEEKISQFDPEAVFLEVYWDGKFISPFKGYKYRGFRLFEEAAIPSADRVGESLQPILSAIQTDSIFLLAHSLGARVVLKALTASAPDTTATPSQPVVNIWLVGPALGSEAFNLYYQRNSKVDYRSRDNYRLSILYNEQDFVLNKTFRWAFFTIDVPPTRYGNTSLGCNFDSDLDRLRKKFREQFHGSPFPVLVEVQTDERGKRVICHRIQCYIDNLSLRRLFEGRQSR